MELGGILGARWKSSARKFMKVTLLETLIMSDRSMNWSSSLTT